MLCARSSAALRGLGLVSLSLGLFACPSRGGVMTGNYTAGFDINRGYSELSSFSVPNVSVGALSTGSSSPFDNFFETANSGGGVTHSFTVAVTNVGSVPITTYRFQVGVSNLNWWLSADNDGDAQPDRTDVD